MTSDPTSSGPINQAQVSNRAYKSKETAISVTALVLSLIVLAAFMVLAVGFEIFLLRRHRHCCEVTYTTYTATHSSGTIKKLNLHSHQAEVIKEKPKASVFMLLLTIASELHIALDIMMKNILVFHPMFHKRDRDNARRERLRACVWWCVTCQPSMKKWVLYFLIVQYGSSNVLNIVPSPDSTCTGDVTGESCLTLQQFSTTPVRSSVTLELFPGQHHLESIISGTEISSFIMRGSDSTVFCRNPGTPNFDIHFTQLQLIEISGITFDNCTIHLSQVINATFVRNAFVNRITGGANVRVNNTGSIVTGYALSNVIISETVFGNNHGGAIVMLDDCDHIEIHSSNFTNNTATLYGIVHIDEGNVTVIDTIFSSNMARIQDGGALNVQKGNVSVENSIFINNRANHHGGAIYIQHGSALVISNTDFTDNAAITGSGGAIHCSVSSLNPSRRILLTNTTFTNNSASSGRGGAIYSGSRYTTISVMRSTFTNNRAADCMVLDVTESFHPYVNLTGSSFSSNMALGRPGTDGGGGVICVRSSSILLSSNNFTDNSAAGNAGVLSLEECDVVVERCTFRNNRAGGNGGVFYTNLYPITYSISQSSFINNQAGGDGGVMYVGVADSQLTILSSVFTFNHASQRGGVIAIIGSTLVLDGSSVSENTAQLGAVVSACNSTVNITNSEIPAIKDPINPSCFFYGVNPPTEVTTAISRPTPTSGTTELSTDTVRTTKTSVIGSTLLFKEEKQQVIMTLDPFSLSRPSRGLSQESSRILAILILAVFVLVVLEIISVVPGFWHEVTAVKGSETDLELAIYVAEQVS